MQTYVPSYYNKFSCIKSNCKHNCCIGWEIDIDNDTYKKYLNVGGNFANRLKQNICGKTPHFALTKSGRCPFLNDDNLCDIIINLGEDYLCEICSLHPRFVNYFESRIEVGLGLCCEEAAGIILTNTEKVQIVTLGSKDTIINQQEKAFFSLRNRILEILSDREKSISDRVLSALNIVGVDCYEPTGTEIYGIYNPLERLDVLWEIELNKLLKGEKYSLPNNWEIVAEQILVYFVYRHLSEGINDGLIAERLKFAVLSYSCIKEICKGYKDIVMEKVIDIARMYSAEVEYSDVNLSNILSKI